jgi:hypothetical protein
MTEFFTLPENLEVIIIAKINKPVNPGEIFYEEACWKQVKVKTAIIMSPLVFPPSTTA